MSRLRLVFSEAVRSVTANVSTTFAATVTVLIGMFLVGVLIAFSSYARSWSNHTKEQLLVKVYFCVPATCSGRDATIKQVNEFGSRLRTNPLVRSFQFVSKEKGLKRIEKTHPELVQNLPANPLPYAFDVKPVSGDVTERLASSLYPFPSGVEKVCPPPPGVKLHYGKEDCGRKATRTVLRVARVIESISGVGIALLLVAAMLLIANTIRLSIFSRRREIEVMKLVGASNWFVRGPFVLEGLICGLVGSLAAIVLLILGKELVLGNRWFDDPDVHALPFALNALIVIGIGLLLGAAGSGLTLRRFLRV